MTTVWSRLPDGVYSRTTSCEDVLCALTQTLAGVIRSSIDSRRSRRPGRGLRIVLVLRWKKRVNSDFMGRSGLAGGALPRRRAPTNLGKGFCLSETSPGDFPR